MKTLLKIALASLGTALLLFSTGCVSQLDQVPAGAEVELKSKSFSFEKEHYTAGATMLERYLLTPGDQLEILYQTRYLPKGVVFRVARHHTLQVKFVNASELNQRETVMPNGAIALPYVGEVKVVGKTLEELNSELSHLYAPYLKDPEINVTVVDSEAGVNRLKEILNSSRGRTRTVTVGPDGFCTFPLLGAVRVAGKNIQEVNEDLNKRYVGILPDIRCDLILERHADTGVYVLGDVKRGGFFKINRPATVLEALAMAGGPQSTANLESVVVLRRHQGKVYAKKVDASRPLALASGSGAFFLRPDDIVYLPQGEVFRMAEVMDAVQKVFMFRGWGISIGGDVWQNTLF